MYRGLRNIVCLVAAVMLTGIAACHADSYKARSTELHCILEEFHQDAFSTCTSSPENYMEQTLGGHAATVAAQYDNIREQSSARFSFSLATVANVVHTLVSCADGIQTGISRLSDYYIFTLGHILV